MCSRGVLTFSSLEESQGSRACHQGDNAWICFPTTEGWGSYHGWGLKRIYRWASRFCRTGTPTSWCSGSWLVRSRGCLWWKSCGWRRKASAASGSGPGLAARWLPFPWSACWWSSRGRNWPRCWAVLACWPDRWAHGAICLHSARLEERSKSGTGSWGYVAPTKQQKWRL